jgi:hypothetical protein
VVGSLAVHSRADGDVGGPEGAVALVRFRISNFPISHVHLRYWREEVGEGLFVEFEAGGILGEEGFDEGGFFALEFEDTVFDGAAADEFVDEDGLGLADAVGAVGGLVFGSLLSACQHRPDFFSMQSDRSLWRHTRNRRSRRLHSTPAAGLPLPRSVKLSVPLNVHPRDVILKGDSEVGPFWCIVLHCGCARPIGRRLLDKPAQANTCNPRTTAT